MLCSQQHPFRDLPLSQDDPYADVTATFSPVKPLTPVFSFPSPCSMDYLCSNRRTAAQIFESMQDEFSCTLLVPISVMHALAPLKFQRAA